ncbi:dihydrolipoyl dehydrogenase [Desulfospira joergensenii]|uniref:dihydrolipoyl dehydrogenase n=1 Tax=Desulfospira joergensenii TaxID=53329 RepID=UPI0003B4C702|nr:dihydrolipoyl dehydrogenase [Desulfospira joergensenii]
MKKYDVAIIGAGTAGLTARAEVAKKTDNYVVIDGGILGTTCARVGCMPSKALIEVANTFHKQTLFDRYGISRSKMQTPDYKQVMAHVRSLRDRFSGGVIRGMESWKDHFIPKNGRFIDLHTLDLGDEKIQADKIVIATGSKPFIPDAWKKFSNYLLDTDTFFELETLPGKIAVFGLGPIGIELGQALSRLNIDVVAMIRRNAIGGLTDPDLRTYAHQCFSDELNIQIGSFDILEESSNRLKIESNGNSWTVDRILLAMGRRPVLKDLGLEKLGVHLDEKGIPIFNETTLQLGDFPVFIAGDVNGTRPILHEAADEGRIAGYNATASDVECFEKRTPLNITFSSPNICVAGQSHADLKKNRVEFVTGETDYEHQGRAMIMGQNRGKIHIYGDKKDGRLLGTEMIAPAGEHMAHLLAWAIANKMRAQDTLAMPFYHPVLEEALRTALRSIAKQSQMPKSEFEFSRCGESIVK